MSDTSAELQETQTIASGMDVLHEGYPSKGVYILLQGRVSVSRLDEQDRRVVLAELAKGEVFGEMGLISNQPCSATVTAIGEVKVRYLSREQFMRAMAGNIQSVEGVLATLFKRMRQMNSRVVELEGQLAAMSQNTDVDSVVPEVFDTDSVSLSGLTPQATHALGDVSLMKIEMLPFRIGRWSVKKKKGWFSTAEENDLDIHDIPPYGISLRHCCLKKKRGVVVLQDESRMGTWLNGERVKGEVIVDAGVHTLTLGDAYGVFAFEMIVR